MEKLILIVLDGLNAQTAFRHMGYLESLAEAGLCATYRVISELPAMSRPLYETIQTGLAPREHGITNNGISKRSGEENIFSIVRQAGGVTAACAYSWVSELYHHTPFRPSEDRFFADGEGEIVLGSFYWNDKYPDDHLFADAHYFIKTYAPEYLLLHPMNVDDAGHAYGSDAAEYAFAAANVDVALSDYLPLWREAGYQVVVTADHGMNPLRFHNGASDAERIVPLYIFSEKILPGDFRDQQRSQREVAPLCLYLLGLSPSKKMIPMGFARRSM